MQADPGTDLMDRVVTILEQARTNVVRNVNTQMVAAYWLIGREIVQAVQGGDGRAAYGKQVLESLAVQLGDRYGRGYSVTNLKYFRLFYQAYADRYTAIRHTTCDELPVIQNRQTLGTQPDVKTVPSEGLEFLPSLSWSHYRCLCKIDSPAERQFYESEAAQAGWSLAQLEKHIHSHLYLRVRRSSDPIATLEHTRRAPDAEKPIDIIKHPYVLDFLNLPDAPPLHESKLESAIIERLQPFMLELGKGFAFVGRQYRVGTELQYFYIDLVFYHYRLKCFVLIDLKMGRLSHQDVGQMDMYVRMFDDLERSAGDNPTVGLILCAERDEVVARYSVLHESQQLFASKYLLHLPSVEQLQEQLRRDQSLIASHTSEDDSKP